MTVSVAAVGVVAHVVIGMAIEDVIKVRRRVVRRATSIPRSVVASVVDVVPLPHKVRTQHLQETWTVR